MLSSVISRVESHGSWAMLGFSILMIGVAFLVTKYAIADPWYRLAKSTKAEWDDLLFIAFSKRLYFFVLIGGIHITLLWIYGDDSKVFLNIAPLFSVTYIIISTSLASIITKFVIPVLIDSFTTKSSVTVSGGNPLISYFLRVVIWFGGVYLALTELGIELFGLLASLAVFSLILGLAMQQTIGNIMNSFMLAVDRPFEVGDRIEVDGVLGSVVSVGVLSTKLLTREEKLVVIPNNTLIDSTLVNHARGGGDGQARRISVVIDIGVDYREDIDHVKFTLLKLAKDCPYVMGTPPPRVLLSELGDYSKTFKVFGWIEDYTDEWVARDWLLKEIDERFSKESIVIPYPIAVELQDMAGGDPDREKASRQRIAKVQMSKEERKQRKERESAKSRVEEIEALLKDAETNKKEIPELEEEKRVLENTLAMFEMDDD